MIVLHTKYVMFCLTNLFEQFMKKLWVFFADRICELDLVSKNYTTTRIRAMVAPNGDGSKGNKQS